MPTHSLQSLLPDDLDVVSVSLDLESTLAHCHNYFINQYNLEFGSSYVHEDIDGWNWVRTEVEFSEFNRIVEDGWLNNTDSIEMMEPALPENVTRLHQHPRIEVDIITARTGVEAAMQDWLDANYITQYGEFRSTTKSKARLDYDVYIDDKPGLADELSSNQMQFLIQGPHNTIADTHDRTIAVPTVRDASQELHEYAERKTL